jgi:uncharacterized protein
MSCREVQDFAEVVIDSLRFAADGDCIAGKLALSRMPRLAELLTNQDGWLDCRLTGYRQTVGGTAKCGLHLQVNGRLGMACQRCLAEVDFDCAVDSRLLLVSEGEQWPEDELEADDYDAIEANRELSVLALVEEEVLLALPIVPRHADCRAPAQAGTAEKESRPSPFSALAVLKKH